VILILILILILRLQGNAADKAQKRGAAQDTPHNTSFAGKTTLRSPQGEPVGNLNAENSMCSHGEIIASAPAHPLSRGMARLSVRCGCDDR
jgi:hypothetical protein